MKLDRRADPAAVAAAAVTVVEELLAASGRPRVGFPTGKTPLPFFAALARRRAEGVSTDRLRPFMLDEYRGVAPSDPGSFNAFLHRHVIAPLGIAEADALCFDGAAVDPAVECARYERALHDTGGIELAILGLGGNGHIAFNEPGSAGDSRTRVLDLTPESIAASRADLPDAATLPTQALSVGVATLMEARAVLLLVTGAGKADILSRALTGPVGPEVPASFLQKHPNLIVIADAPAVARLPAAFGK